MFLPRIPALWLNPYKLPYNFDFVEILGMYNTSLFVNIKLWFRLRPMLSLGLHLAVNPFSSGLLATCYFSSSISYEHWLA